ncbi:MAG TPA: hydroxyacid dehydrogenase [Polyangia bacterium]|jgi:phosphoglycerate dehydrogenase-like enzyme|nr:hydroxyacid dehydrogenase [Polyangia bacterium]
MRDGDVYGGRREKISELTELYPHVVTAKNFNDHAAQLREVEVIFATWGMISFTEAHFAAMPKLRAVFYAAGNVKAFAPPLVERGVVLVSAWAVNAIPTAELVYAQILLTCRGYFRGVRQYAATRDAAAAKDFRRAGAAGETIGLLGTGFIAQKLTKHLHAHGFRVIASASDPFLTDERARAMGVERVPLEEVFARSYVVSNHVPDLPSTKHILGGALFERMREGATFINSGRGAQVIEAELARVLAARPDLTALLDVTFPEPPAPESPLWRLPNVVMSPHVGGTIGDEVGRLADCVIEEFLAWRAGQPLRYQVTREVLATMG